jgi:hypothetical protein
LRGRECNGKEYRAVYPRCVDTQACFAVDCCSKRCSFSVRKRPPW